MHGMHSSLRFALRRLHEFKVWLRNTFHISMNQQMNNTVQMYVHIQHACIRIYIYTYVYVYESCTPQTLKPRFVARHCCLPQRSSSRRFSQYSVCRGAHKQPMRTLKDGPTRNIKQLQVRSVDNGQRSINIENTWSASSPGLADLFESNCSVNTIIHHRQQLSAGEGADTSDQLPPSHSERNTGQRIANQQVGSSHADHQS